MGRVKSSTPLARILTFARLFTGLTSAARIQRMLNSFTKEEREISLAGDREFPNLNLRGELHHVGGHSETFGRRSVPSGKLPGFTAFEFENILPRFLPSTPLNPAIYLD
jgi:hypothetical protein